MLLPPPSSPSYAPPSKGKEKRKEGRDRRLQNQQKNCRTGLKGTSYNGAIRRLTAFKTSELARSLLNDESLLDDEEDTQFVARCSTNWYISTQLDGIPALTCDEFEENECLGNVDLDYEDEVEVRCLEPSTMPSASPSAVDTPVPTDFPTDFPTDLPTDVPTDVPTSETPRPTESPSDSPTTKCSTASTAPDGVTIIDVNSARDFNLCLAIDMSGSVCNGDSSLLCLDCEPLNVCRSGKENRRICCPNFSNALKFSEDLIDGLSDLPSDRDYSVVHYATAATVASTSESGPNAIDTIKNLNYSGGKTNLADAISSCQSTLDRLPRRSKNYIVVFTDGFPTQPTSEMVAEGTAVSAAKNAKIQGTVIIPVLREDRKRDGFANALEFLREDISSNGEVFSLSPQGSNDLIDFLVKDLASCQ